MRGDEGVWGVSGGGEECGRWGEWEEQAIT